MRTKFAFIAAYASEHAIRFMCRVIGVTRSCHYAWQRAAPGAAWMVDLPEPVGLSELGWSAFVAWVRM